MRSISIKELHEKTGEWVRGAGTGWTPVEVTDRGKLVAVLAPPHLCRRSVRKRVLIPEYAAFLARARSEDVLEDLSAVRGDR
jgi:antitoxin (DNA-binding transcriptional repressor) of toxin-antitoxin stability system